MRTLRVALDATPLLGRPTGVGAFCAGALSGLAGREDTDVAAFALTWRRRHLLPDLLPAGVSWSQRPMPARPLHALWQRESVPPVDWFIPRVDVVHGTNFVVPPTARPLPVVTVHDLTPVRFPEMCDRASLAFPALIRQALDRGAWVHTPSRAVAAEVVDVFSVDPARVRAVPSGIPPLPPVGAGRAGGPPRAVDSDGSDVLPLLSGLGTAGSPPRGTTRFLLAVGTVEPRKDLPGLVRAFDLLASDRSDLALVLVGPSGWGSDALDDAVARSGWPGRIVRTGWVDQPTLAELLTRAAVLVYPSLYEGFGFPPLQAMQLGVPVVSTTAGALPEVIGGGAELVTPGDVTALAEAIAKLLDDDVLRSDLVARGHDCAALYSWERTAAGLVDLYRDALEGTRRR